MGEDYSYKTAKDIAWQKSQVIQISMAKSPSKYRGKTKDW